MEKLKERLSTVSPLKNDYWEIRHLILDAIRYDDHNTLLTLAQTHPGIFQNVVNQAKNGLKQWRQ